MSAKATAPVPIPACLGQVNQGRWCQETYETASRHAAIRARALRKLGYRVTSSALGPQVTGLGLLKLTLIDIRPASVDGDALDLPAVKIERTR